MKYTLAFLSLGCIICTVITNEKYAKQLEIPDKTSSEMLFEFDLNVEWKLTMGVYDENHHLDIVNYWPEKQEWLVRNKNQLEECDLQQSFNDSLISRMIQLDGLHQIIIAVNGKSPAEPIVVPYGSEVIMRIHNNLVVEEVTVHVHGLDKRYLWYMDGVAHVQQCPIHQGSTFTYRFIADSPGTNWWHGHQMIDRGEGFLGAFIVTDRDETILNRKNENIKADRQYAVLLQDWNVPTAHMIWHNHIWESMKWLYGYDKWDTCWAPTRTYDGSNVGGSVPLSALLVNSKGWHNQTQLKSIPEKIPLETFKIKRGESVLLRLINGGTAQAIMISLENHRMTVVAADGFSVKPTVVDMLILFSGERYDVLIEAMENPLKRDYYLILETLEHYDWNWKKLQQPFYGLAVVRYDDVPHTMHHLPDFGHTYCQSVRNKCIVLNCPFERFPAEHNYDCMPAASLKTLHVINKQILSTEAFESNFEEHFINMVFDDSINGYNFKPAKGMPYFYNGREHLVADWCDKSKCHAKPDHLEHDVARCKCFHHLNFTLNNTVQLNIYNMGRGSEAGRGYAHPFHIHGTHLYVMKVGYPDYNSTNNVIQKSNSAFPCVNGQSCNQEIWANKDWLQGKVPDMNAVDPSYRDTIVVPPGGYVVLRFQATNPGWFYAHCHTMIHHIGGMAFAIRIGTHEQMPKPPADFPHDCGIYEPTPLNSALKRKILNYSFH